MKKLSIQSGILVAAVLAVPLIALAAEFRAGDAPAVAREEIINDDLYIAGGSVTIAGAVRGDLISGGGVVLVSGPVANDAMVGGGTVTILGDVGDDVRVGGGTIVVQGAVVGDIVAAGGQVTLAGARVGGDVAIAGGSIRIDSSVGGNVTITGGEVYLNAPVSGAVEIMQAEKVTLGPKANIAGTFTYSAPKAATIEDGAVVRGETTFTERAGRAEAQESMKAAFAAFLTLWFFGKFLMLFVGALVFAYIFKRYARELVAHVAARPLAELGRGVVALVVTPVVSIILLITVIGIPFGILGLLAFAAFFVVCALLAPIVVGSLIHTWIWKPAQYEVNWKTILLGAFAYMVIGLVPFLGGILKFGILLMILGAVIGIKWRVAKEWR